jgi:hypothetical protein
MLGIYIEWHEFNIIIIFLCLFCMWSEPERERARGKAEENEKITPKPSTKRAKTRERLSRFVIRLLAPSIRSADQSRISVVFCLSLPSDRRVFRARFLPRNRKKETKITFSTPYHRKNFFSSPPLLCAFFHIVLLCCDLWWYRKVNFRKRTKQTKLKRAWREVDVEMSEGTLEIIEGKSVKEPWKIIE